MLASGGPRSRTLATWSGRCLAIVLEELRRDLRIAATAEPDHIYRSTRATTGARKRPTSPAPPTKSGPRRNSPARPANTSPSTCSRGLDHYPRAIEILLDAHRREVLDEGGQSKLVEFLRSQNRFAETIPILEPLVQRRPDNLQYRVWLMNAWFKTGKPERLAKLLKETHDYFHQDDRWNEQAMAMLGRSCLENEIYLRAVDYLKEYIRIIFYVF